LNVPPTRLLTLVKPALDQGASVTLFADAEHQPDFLSQLPAMVEVSPLAILDDYLDWLDYLAVDLEREDLERLSAHFPSPSLPFDGQILVHTPMPCRGLGSCGVCSLRTTKGWRLACKDGPVFPLQEVLHVAQ
jgi:dihydroorotate dehydrogenase electron transfer subunit